MPTLLGGRQQNSNVGVSRYHVRGSLLQTIQFRTLLHECMPQGKPTKPRTRSQISQCVAKSELVASITKHSPASFCCVVGYARTEDSSAGLPTDQHQRVAGLRDCEGHGRHGRGGERVGLPRHQPWGSPPTVVSKGRR